MKNLFNLDAPIVQFAGKMATLLWMNVLWLFCCLPLLTIGASTTALYRMMFNLRQDKSCTAKDFFRAFAANFKQATVHFLILLLLFAVLYAYYYGICLVTNQVVQFLLLAAFCAMFLFVGFTAVYVFPLTAYFENSVLRTLRNALILSVTHYRQTVIVFALSLLPAIALAVSLYWFLRLGYIWALIAPGLIAYWSSGQLQKVFDSCAEQP
ncbi:MAG: YesL family protein [Oscillospiraceae bacterium]|nr:YesL family protein [Oscillospiraceae bacterium]